MTSNKLTVHPIYQTSMLHKYNLWVYRLKNNHLLLQFIFTATSKSVSLTTQQNTCVLFPSFTMQVYK